MAFSFPNNEVLLLDGGFGTTLEDVFGKDISGALWSASLVDKEPDTVVNAHSAFLESGSDIFLTSTYQCAFETFKRAGYTEADAVRLMRKSVRLASLAKKKHLATSAVPLKTRLVLSLGPFGATLSPAQEFDGIYPPPYGPREFDASGANTSAFNDAVLEEASIEALAKFHYSRLCVFINKVDEEEGEEANAIWCSIDGLAFETVPLAREVTAIRRAMGRLARDLEERGLSGKPWWVSTVWPGGVYPQENPGGGRLVAEDVVCALLEEDDAGLPAPDGIGINCTHIDDLDNVVRGIRAHLPSHPPTPEGETPFLVLYPNGGGVYDIVNHCWKDAQASDATTANHAADAWSHQLVTIAKRERESGAWKGVAIGGCCKTGPRHVELLGSALHSSRRVGTE